MNWPPFATRPGAQPWLSNPMPPWHMWGTSEQVTIPIIDSGSGNRQVTQQLSRVNYKRPETWHWLFYARIVQSPTDLEGNGFIVAVNFNVVVGLGRASVSLPEFQRFVFTWTAPEPPPESPLWSTRALSPDDEEQGTAQVVAQDIQCSSQIIVSTVNSPLEPPMVVEVAAFFAPKNHIRPEWFSDEAVEAQFPGAETGGL